MNLLVPSATDDGGFHGPSLDEFFPPGFLFVGTPFEINRIMAIRIVITALILLLFWLGTRKMTVIPGRGQSIVEMLLGFIRTNIAEDTLGRKDGTRFLPLLTAMFITIAAMNFTGVFPGINMAGTAVIGMPLLLALVAYVAFIYAGVKKHPAAFFKNALFPPGVPWPIYFVVTPIEFISTFILRPVTLALRLLMNMIAGHMLLVLCFSATWFFLFTAGGWYSLFSVGTFAFGFAFTLFELFVGVLQAYVFTLLTAVYIQLALAEEH
ncbi:MAG: F0F1 ATP synthase subunit A [Leifsonia sp.]